MKLHISTKYPSGDDTFWIPKVRACFDDRYKEIEPKICDIVNTASGVSFKTGDKIQLWNGNSSFIIETECVRVRDIEISFEDKDLVIRIDGRIKSHGFMRSGLCRDLGCFCFGDFVELCEWLTNDRGTDFRGQLVYWSLPRWPYLATK